MLPLAQRVWLRCGEGLSIGRDCPRLTRVSVGDDAAPHPFRLRAHGQLVELRVADLALGDAEAARLLAAVDVPQPDEVVARLVERTEGWPAAMYLAALSLRSRPDPGEFVDRFTGTSRHVADFLTEDVLAVVPLDDERAAYRYHHLFAQYLRAELTRRHPELVSELHQRAWRWYRAHGLTGRAVTHAQAAGDLAVAADLISATWFSMRTGSRLETLRGWIAGFDDTQIAAHAPLAIAAAWTGALAGKPERAARLAAIARGGSWSGPMPDGSVSLESALAIMSGSGLDQGGLSGKHAAAQRAVDLEPPTSVWRPLALLSLGTVQTMQGDWASARQVLDEAVVLTQGQTGTSGFALAHLAVISLRAGDEEQALGHARRAHEIAERPGMRSYMPSVITYAVLAHLLGRRGDLEGARLAAERASELLPRVTEVYWWLMVETRILLAPALTALDRRGEALALLDEAAASLAAHPDAGQLPQWHDEAMRRLRHRRPPPSEDLTDAEQRILRLLGTNLTLREIGRELYLSMNTVKTHTSAIYRKLGVSSRAAAVQAAVGRHSQSPG